MATDAAPKTLREAILYFSDYDHCRKAVESIRWPDGIVRCPQCGSAKVSYLASVRRYKCYGNHPKAQFSLKVGTIFEDSPLGLEKWLPALWLLVNCKNGISSYELARALGITQKSAWFMLHRLRLALQDSQTGGKLNGTIEVDETFIGGKARNMHEKKRKRLRETYETHGPTAMGKVVVMGLLERHDGRQSRIRTKMLTGRDTAQLMSTVVANVERGATVTTDEHKGYGGVVASYQHKVINHAEKYVDGQIHINGCENFWSLLKRAIRGTYVSVEPFHLFRYLDEQSFRFNERSLNDAGRFFLSLAGIVNRRLTYKALTGSELPQTC